MKILQEVRITTKTYTLIKNINSDTDGTKVLSALTHDGYFLKMLLQCSRKEIVLPQLQAATYTSVKVPASRSVVPEDGLNALADCNFP